MSKQLGARCSLILLVVAAFVGGLASGPQDGWAKHKTKVQQTGSTDPCVEPTAFVQQQVAKIKTLQASLNATTANSVAGLFSEFEGQKRVDADKLAQISELRHDADSVDELLRAGGCKTVDIDRELGGSPVSTGSVSTQK
jgi:hypothetical protein